VGTFRFKQFAVTDDRSVMKVGTDAVLLGAWCDVGTAGRILDIGTGSGLIALMLAQRSAIQAHIDAVEMLAEDVSQAKENFKNSRWPDKISVFHRRIQDYSTTLPYDVIISNPPFFSGSLKPPQPGRTIARHDANLSHRDLLDAAVLHLRDSGQLSTILPVIESERLLQQAGAYNLHLRRRTRVFSRESKPQERTLMSLNRERGPIYEDSLVLYQQGNAKTTAFRELTGSFYLD